MSAKKKNIFFGIILVILLVIVGFRVYTHYFAAPATPIHATEKNKMASKTFVVKKQREIKSDGKELKSGFYDCKVVAGVVSFNGIPMKKGQKILNNEVLNDIVVNLTGSGKITFTASRFTKLKFRHKVTKLTNTYGNFYVGKDIPQGKYQIKILGDGAAVNVMTEKKNTGSANGDSYQSGQTTSVKLAAGSILRLWGPMGELKPNKNVTIELTRE